jgi:hypothetical protein
MAVTRLEASWEIIEVEAKACMDALVQVSVRLAALRSTKASPRLLKYASQRDTLTAILVKQFESNSMALYRCLDKYGAVARQMVRMFDAVDPIQEDESYPTSEAGPKLVRSMESAQFSQPMRVAVRAPDIPRTTDSVPAADTPPRQLHDSLRETLAIQATQDLVRGYSCEHWRRVQLLQKLSDSRSADEIRVLASAWSTSSPQSYIPAK